MSSEDTTSPGSPSRVTCYSAATLAFLIIVPTSYLTLTLSHNAGGEQVYDMPSPDWKDPNRIIFLAAGLLSADVPEGTMLVEWKFTGDTCDVDCSEVNIFFDPNLSPSDDRRDDGPSNNDAPTEPTFVWNNDLGSIFIDPKIGRPHSTLRFRTKHIIEPTFQDFKFNSEPISLGTLAFYPFDRYFAIVFAFAQEASTNKSVSLVLYSATGFIADLKVTAVSSDYTALEQITYGREVIEVYLFLQRSTLIIAYCLVITITFWMVTLMICLIMITTVVFGYRQRNEIVVVPIGTVFAFTQLRSTMPGAPEGFGGILDFIGLLPCLILLSICAVTMVGIYLFTDPHDPSRKAFTWDELVNALRLFIGPIWKHHQKMGKSCSILYTDNETEHL